jgi:hypothetical protein
MQADYSQHFSHDQRKRFPRDEKLTPRLVWEQVRASIVLSPNGNALFDDTRNI